MPKSFPGFAPEALKFLRALKRHNDREWFQPRKEQFETLLRDPMLELVAAINGELVKFAPDYVSDPAKSLFRIYRDTRFSKDKSPYKTRVAAVFSHRKMPRNHGAGFYFQVSPEKTGIGGGIYHPGTELLKALRQHVAANHEEYRRTMRKVESRKIAGEFEGEPSSRVPKGWNPAHPAAELLKCRSLFYYAELPPETMTESGLHREIASRFRAISEFVQLLDRPIVGQKKFSLTDFG